MKNRINIESISISSSFASGGGRDEDLREDGPRAERVAQDKDGQVRRRT